MLYITLIFLSIFVTPSHAENALHTHYAHGIVATAHEVQQAALAQSIIHSTHSGTHFADSRAAQGYSFNTLIYKLCSLFGKSVNRQKMYMGTGPDIDQWTQEVTTLLEEDKQLILYGVSRGGATILSGLSHLALEKLSCIKAVVLEGTPANIPSSLIKIQNALGCRFITKQQSLEQAFRYVFPGYAQNPTQPIDAISDIKLPKDTPIFIAHSVSDKRVPFVAAQELYAALHRQGFTHTYLIPLPESRHAYAYKTPAACTLYQQTINSFYKKYDLPHDDSLAILDISMYQPDVTIVQAAINRYYQAQEAWYQTRKRQNRYFLGMLGVAALSYAAYTYFYQQPVSLPLYTDTKAHVPTQVPEPLSGASLPQSMLDD